MLEPFVTAAILLALLFAIDFWSGVGAVLAVVFITGTQLLIVFARDWSEGRLRRTSRWYR